MAVTHPRPTRRYEVFLSSTYDDLKNVRLKLLEATVRKDQIPVGMEMFSSGPRDVDHIRQCINDADVFVILLGARYGSFVKNVGEHFLDLEYRIASELNKPILAYILNDSEYTQARSSLPEGHPERSYDNELRTFRALVSQDAHGYGRLVEFFSLQDNQVDEVVRKYETAIGKLVGSLTAGGWVRGELYDELHSRVSLSRIVSRNPFFSDFVKRLDRFDTLSLRIADEVPDLKASAARYFLESYLGLLISRGVRQFFFESGSSIAFLSQAFIAALRDEQWLHETASELLIHTNNIITYLDFGLSERVRVELYPYGPPEKKYGATFGALTSLKKLSPKQVRNVLERRGPDQSRTEPNWQRGVDALAEWFKKNYGENGVIFMTASGLETDPRHDYHGPHVGSYYNMLFKRAILKSRCPLVMFLDETKILSKPFDTERCFPVCDVSETWQSVCSAIPIAVTVPCRSEQTLRQVEVIMAGLGLHETDIRNEDGVQLLIASNRLFQEWSSNPQSAQ